MTDQLTCDVSIVVPVKDDDHGLAFTLSSINGAAAYRGEGSVEVIVVDGSSSGSSVLNDAEVRWPRIRIRQAVDPGQGPYAAVDCGLRQSCGLVQTWLNAGDYLFPQALKLVALAFADFPSIQWLSGYSCLMTERGLLSRIDSKPVLYSRRLISAGLYRKSALGYLQQEGMFWKRDLYNNSGGLDLSLRLAGDFDLWQRFAKYADLVTVTSPIAAFEVAPSTQRSRRYEQQYLAEVESRSPASFLAALFRCAAAVHYGLVVALRFFAVSPGRIVVLDPEIGDLRECSGVWPCARVSVWNLLVMLRSRPNDRS
jgi:glycosyltransferase involved in cell wall biosynthesis